MIIILTDYKGTFGSKHNAVPYRSGMDKEVLKTKFKKHNIDVRYVAFSDVDFSEDWEGKIVLYTSSEDNEYRYKSYIEDIVYGLELKGAIVIPRYSHLKANNNKVFMEILRASLLIDVCDNRSRMFGTLEEGKKAINKKEVQFPVVFKQAEGACSSGVGKADNPKELEALIKSMCATKDIAFDTRDYLRAYRHKGYIRESKYRHKFILQPMIKGLKNDWKLLIFGNKIFNLKRHVRKNDFRASGSHNDYKIGADSGLTSEMMDFAYDIYNRLNVPMLSFDLAYDGNQCYMIEFQSLYFGSSTFLLCKDYYCKDNKGWSLKAKESDSYEELYAWSINEYLVKNNIKID